MFWGEAIGKSLQGELAEADLLKKASDGTFTEKKQKCQALIYIGSVYLSSGDKAKARELFQEAAETGDYRSDEFITARFRLRQLSTK